MATRGVFQLQKLNVNYCEHGGSSRMLREFIASGRLSKWASAHPHGEWTTPSRCLAEGSSVYFDDARLVAMAAIVTRGGQSEIAVVYQQHAAYDCSEHAYTETSTFVFVFRYPMMRAVEILVTPRNGNHPYIQGNYKTCSTIRHQVSVKNYQTPKEIQDVLDMLHSRSGRKITKITTPVLTDTPSIQGIWTPFLSLAEEQPKITIHEAR